MDKPDASESSFADESPHSGGGSVLRMIRDLTLELHPDWRRRLVVRPESDLDRDLGYDSLARAELMLRINREFGIRLSDQLIVDAATAGDISDAVASAAPARMRQEPKDERRPIILPQSAAPEEAETLLDALAAHVRAHPDRPHVRLWSGEGQEQSLTYGALDRGARVIAKGLATRGVTPGDRLAIMLPTGAEFFEAFFGALQDPKSAREVAFRGASDVLEAFPDANTAEVWDWEPKRWLGAKGHRNNDQLTKYLITAAKHALIE